MVIMSTLTDCDLVSGIIELNLVNMGTGYDLLPDGSKPLPEPIMTCHLTSIKSNGAW